MWLAKMQMEVLRFPENGVKMVAKVLNPHYAEVIQRKLQQQGIEAGIGKTLDVNNDLRLRSLSEDTRNYFSQEQKKYFAGWNRVLRDNMEKWVAAGCLQDEEEAVKHYQPLFPKLVWPYFEELVKNIYHHICRRMDPEMIAKEFLQDLYDVTDGKCLRLCRCYDAETHLLVEESLREVLPEHELCWIECRNVNSSEQEKEVVRRVLPNKGQDKRERDFYDAMFRWVRRFKTHYARPDDFKAAFQYHVNELELPPNLAKVAAMVWERYVSYQETKKQTLRIQHLRCANLKTMLEDYFHVEIHGGVEPEDFGYKVTVHKEPAEKHTDKNEAQHKEEEYVGPKYYAVAKGKICGVFTDPELYEKALGRRENSLSEVFPSYKAAKKWLRRQREEAQAKQKAAASPQQSDNRRKTDQLESEESVKAAAADSVPAAQERQPNHAARTVKLIKDSREYLLQIFKGMPLAEPEDAAVFQGANLSGVRRETAEFLDYANEHHVDIIGRLKRFMEQQSKKLRTGKQLANALLHQEMIPSSYKLLLQDIFAHLDDKKALKKKKQNHPELTPQTAAAAENSQEFAAKLEAIRKHFQGSAAAAAKPQKRRETKKEKLARKTAAVKYAAAKPTVSAEPEEFTAELSKAANDVQTKNEAKAAQPAASHRPAPLTDREQKRVNLFRGIQFDKHISRHVPQAYQERFRRTFARRLVKMQTIFSGDRRAAGNDFKMVAGAHGKRVFKRRIGDHRLSMVYKDGILTLLALSSHDRQMTDIRKIRGKSIGYVYYDTADFLYQLDAWQEQGETKHLSLGDYLATPTHFVFDEDQKAIIESTEKAENLSVIGNAGAGKSVVGLKWLREELQKPKNDALYLTMSENLVYTLQFEFEKEKAENAAAMKSDAEIRTTFDFLRAEVKVAYPQIPEKKLLNAAQSFAVFVEFWAEKVDWTQFWDHKDKAFAHQTEEMTRLSAWREIHGIIKGAVPEDVDYLHLTKISPCLREDEYQKRLQQEKKSSRSTVLWETTLYRVYEKYQRYLRRRELFDDNDMARLLLKSKAKNLRNVRKYGAVFVDECQDLTQMELLAIFHLLGGTRHKRMASDRCQMVQPTYFDEGWMRTASNDYDRANGRRIEDIGLRPRFLHYNYRSSRSIIDFQNYLVQFFRRGGLLTLRQDELREIAVPPLTTQGMKPVWVMAGAKNREHLIHDLWRKVPASDLQTIFAFAGSKSKEDFPWTEADAVTDIIHCKGMEYPSVLLYNILSETCDNPALAWKYFYVGATRGNACLIIYEEAAKPGTKLYEFLEDAAIEGLIDYADDLLGKADYGEMTWLGYLYQNIHENTAENRHETAENALNFGQYELALSIYASEGRDENMTAYCRGRVAESHGDYEAAMRAYVSLAPDWSNRGRTRQNAAETLLTHPDIAGREFLAAYCLTGRGSEDLIAQAKEAWRYKYGEAKQRYFYEALFEALQTYPCLQQSFTRWREIEEQRLQKTQAAVQRAVAEWPLPEPTVRQDTAAGDTELQVMAKLNETESEDDKNVI